MMQTLQYIRLVRPKSIVFESVTGMQTADAGDERSLATMLCEEVKKEGYGGSIVTVCLSSFHTVVRQRLSP